MARKMKDTDTKEELVETLKVQFYTNTDADKNPETLKTRHVWDRAPPLQRCDCTDRHSVDGNTYVAEGNENYPPRSHRFKIPTMRQHLWARVRAILTNEGEKDDKKSSGEEAQDSELGVKERGTDPGTMTDDQVDAEFRKESHNDEMNFEGTRTRRQEERRDVQLMSKNLRNPTEFKN